MSVGRVGNASTEIYLSCELVRSEGSTWLLVEWLLSRPGTEDGFRSEQSRQNRGVRDRGGEGGATE